MNLKRRMLMASATLFLAAASGHILQRTAGLTTDNVAALPAPDTVVIVSAAATAMEPVVALPAAPQTPSLPATTMTTAKLQPDSATIPDLPMLAEPEPEPVPMPVATNPVDCTPTLALTAMPAAMVGLAFDAPCNASERVVVRHEGLAVTGVLNAVGAMEAVMPAMAGTAIFEIRMSDGTTVEKLVVVPDMADVVRFGVQWQGDDTFQLHAYEFGAGLNDDGHVSAVRPRAPSDTTGGFLTLLGDDQVERPMLAEVYTYPSGRDGRFGSVTIEIEAAVTERTCGRDLLAETLQTNEFGGVEITDLTVAAPDCSAVGDILLLKNLVPELKIAAK